MLSSSISYLSNLLPSSPFASSASKMPIEIAIRKGDVATVKQRLESEPPDLTQKDSEGLTLLDHAILSGNQEILALVISHQLGTNIKDIGQSAIRDHQKTVDIFNTDFTSMRTYNPAVLSELYKAAFDGNLEKLKELVQSSQNLDEFSSEGRSALHYAVLNNKIEAAKLLLEAGARDDLLTTNGESVLHFASTKPSNDFLQLFNLKKFDINQQNKTGYSPLHWAMASENPALIHFLIKNGADLFAKNQHQVAPLHLMISMAYLKASSRDPMKMDIIHAGMVAGILCSLGANYFPANPAYLLNNAGNFLSQFTAAMCFGKAMTETDKVAEAGGNALLNTVVMASSAYFVNGFLSPNDFYTCFSQLATAICVGVVATRTLKSCWKNLKMESWRPLRNGLASAATLCYSLKGLAKVATVSVPCLLAFLSCQSQFISKCRGITGSKQLCESSFKSFGGMDFSDYTWQNKVETMHDRWDTFNTSCSTIKQQYHGKDAIGCKERFFNYLEPGYFASKTHYELNLEELAERYRGFMNVCFQSLVFYPNRSPIQCEKDFFSNLGSSSFEMTQINCPPIDIHKFIALPEK